MNTVFLNAGSTVVQIIIGEIPSNQQALFLRDYAALFGATSLITTDLPAWIGGTYDATTGEFLPPPAEEPA